MSNDGIASSKGASVFFGVVFTALSVIHLGLMVWKRSWLMLWLIVGGILEISSYFSSNAGNGTQTVQVIIAPIFLAASVYISLGSLLKRLEVTSVINNKLQSFLFIMGDIVSFGLQVSGVVLQMILDNKALGKGLAIGGFILQIVSFIGFVTLIVIAQRQIEDDPKHNTMQGFHSWRSYIKALYTVLTLFLIRNIFRLVEYSQGWGGFIFTHAVFAYIFDASTIALIYLILVIQHPGFTFQKIKSQTFKNDAETKIFDSDLSYS